MGRVLCLARIVQNRKRQAVHVLLIGPDKVLDGSRIAHPASLYQAIIHSDHSNRLDKLQIKSLHFQGTGLGIDLG